MSQPRFSIAVIHYEGSVSHAEYVRCVRSVYAQTFGDYELLVYHDGPIAQSNIYIADHVQVPAPTATRANIWGHNLRHIATEEAIGEYLVILNADNTLMPNALEEIDAAIRRPPLYEGDTPDIIIFPILMNGTLYRFNGEHHIMQRDPRANGYTQTIMTGIPPVLNCIDCLNLTMRADLWRKEGGWYDLSETSDGKIYESLCRKYNYSDY